MEQNSDDNVVDNTAALFDAATEQFVDTPNTVLMIFAASPPDDTGNRLIYRSINGAPMDLAACLFTEAVKMKSDGNSFLHDCLILVGETLTKHGEEAVEAERAQQEELNALADSDPVIIGDDVESFDKYDPPASIQ